MSALGQERTSTLTDAIQKSASCQSGHCGFFAKTYRKASLKRRSVLSTISCHSKIRRRMNLSSMIGNVFVE
jgi:hypothetical protein